MAGLSDWFPGLRRNTPYTERWRSFLGDLQSQGVTVDPTQSGGYNPRFIRGTMMPSLHASDRAYDVNWRSNPEGSVQNEYDIARQHLERDMGGSSAPITQIHPMIARETAARHGLRWGGDFRTRSPDPMHFEIAGPAPGGMAGRSLVAHAGLPQPARTEAPMNPNPWVEWMGGLGGPPAMPPPPPTFNPFSRQPGVGAPNVLRQPGQGMLPPGLAEAATAAGGFLSRATTPTQGPGLAPRPDLPADTRLWAALQEASGGIWAGCVYDADRIAEALGGRNGRGEG